MWRFLTRTIPEQRRPAGRKRFHKPYQGHVAVMGIVFVIALILLWVRLYIIQERRHEEFVKEANNQQVKRIPLLPRRGGIFDRKREGIAISTPIYSVYAETKWIQMAEASWVKAGLGKDQRPELAKRLGELFNIPNEPILGKLRLYETTSACFPVVRKVEMERIEDKLHRVMTEFSLPRYGISLARDSKRYYPRQQFAAHVIGGVAMDDFGDNVGREGIEQFYDKYLRGNRQQYESLQSADRRSIEPFTDEMYYAAFGKDVFLAIDSAIQSAAEMELAKMVACQKAIGGVLIVMACRDGPDYSRGAILAMANVPTFDPITPAPPFITRNRAATDAIETGSVMKTILASILLENDLVAYDPVNGVDEIVDCLGGRGYFNSAWVKDVEGHNLHQVPFSEVYAQSSNVGCVNLAQRISPAIYADWLRRFGFGSRTGIDFPGEAAGAISVKYPTDRDRAAFGYSLSVTALQVAAAMAAIGNEGLTVQPHLVREIRDVQDKAVYRFEPGEGRRVIRSVTARKLWNLMEGVVDNGTGKTAKIPGYRIGGKTGTALKYDPALRKYAEDGYMASFACLAPIDEPQIAIYCYIDEPKKDKYGGAVAAPVVREVAHVALRALGVLPRDTDEPPRDVELIVDPIRTRRSSAILAASSDEARRNRRMPDLTGLTMIEAQQALASLPFQIEFQGSGVAIGQNPQPGQPIAGAGKAIITFGKASELRDSEAATSQTARNAAAARQLSQAN